MVLTGRAGLVVLAGAVAVLLWPAGGWTVAAVAGGVLLLAAVDVVLAVPPRALAVRRSGDAAVRLGATAAAGLRLDNPTRRGARLVVRDLWPPSAGAAPHHHELVVPAGRGGRLSASLRPTRRGDLVSAGVTVRSLGPLRVAGRQRTLPVPGRLRVLPEFAGRRHLPRLLSRLRDLDGRVAAQVRGQGTEFDSLREYVVGDDARSIDWRATARRGDVVVRTWRPERERRLVMVVDTGRSSARRAGDVPRLDAVLDAALLLGTLAPAAGDRVDLLAHDVRLRAVASGGGPAAPLAGLASALYRLEPVLVESDVPAMVREVLRRVRRRGLVVLFTGVEPATVEESLLPSLPLLARHHRVLVAAVADPVVQAMAAGRGDAEAVYAAAAAESDAAGRAEAVAALRRQGIEVVEAVPDAFAPAVADAYLSLKAAGRM